MNLILKSFFLLSSFLLLATGCSKDNNISSMTVDELKEYVIGKKYCTIAYDEYLGYRYLCTLTFISPHYVDVESIIEDHSSKWPNSYEIEKLNNVMCLTLYYYNDGITFTLNGTFEDKNTIRVTGENLKNDLIFTINGGPSVDEPKKNEDENTHSKMNYDLIGQFGYVSEYPQEFPTVDSLYYNKYIMLEILY